MCGRSGVDVSVGVGVVVWRGGARTNRIALESSCSDGAAALKLVERAWCVGVWNECGVLRSKQAGVWQANNETNNMKTFTYMHYTMAVRSLTTYAGSLPCSLAGSLTR